jgi:hypothetical protein
MPRSSETVLTPHMLHMPWHPQERLVLQLEKREGPDAAEHPVAIAIKVCPGMPLDHWSSVCCAWEEPGNWQLAPPDSLAGASSLSLQVASNVPQLRAIQVTRTTTSGAVSDSLMAALLKHCEVSGDQV